MLFSRRVEPGQVIGRSPERLSLDELTSLAGKMVAFEIYTPDTTPLRTIEAIGDSAEDCMKQLAASGRDPRRFEYVMLKPPH